MRTRLYLTPSNNVLAYQGQAAHVHIECDSATGAFTVQLPDLFLPEDKEFIFYNMSSSGAGNEVTVRCVSGQLLSTGESEHVLNVGDTVTFVSNLKDKWLLSDVNVYEEAGAAAIVQGNLDDHEALTTTAHGGFDPAGTAASEAGIVQGNLETHEALTTTAHGGIVADDDPRLSDARTPTAHGTTHQGDSSDPVSSTCAFITVDGYTGLAIKATAGETITKGHIVRLSQSADDRIIKVDANGDMPIGVAVSDIASGASGWVIVSGYAWVLSESGSTPTSGYIAYVSATSGEAAFAGTVPSAVTHFREIGHVVRSGTATNLILCVLHFN
jgi:hypothetical protein